MVQFGNLDLFDNSTGTDTLIGIPTDHGLPIGQGPNTPIFWTNAPTNGQILIGSTGSNPVLGTIQAGSGVAITNGPGSITISASSSGVAWQLISSSTTLAVNNGYICVGGGNLSLTLPLIPPALLGDIIEVTLDGATSFSLQAPGAVVRYGNSLTNVGGFLSSTAQGDSLIIVCQGSGRWNVLSVIGNITVS